MENEIKLTGSPAEQAQQLFDFVKDRELTLEQVKELIPFSKEFIQSLVTVLHKTIDTEAKSDEEFYNTMNRLIDSLQVIITDDNISDSQKDQCIQIMQQVAQHISDNKLDRNEKEHRFKMTLAKIAGGVALALIALSAGKKKLFGDRDSNNTNPNTQQ